MAGNERVYSVAEANALLPQIALLLDRQVECMAEIERTVAAWRELGGEPSMDHGSGRPLPDLRPDAADTPGIAAIKQALREWIAVLRETWSAIESTGAIIKDPRTGLVDFAGEYEGQRVWLCWQRGEPEVAYFHRHDECARRPLSDASRDPSHAGAPN